MASPSDGTESALTPRALAIKITAHITLARNTDGEGRTTQYKTTTKTKEKQWLTHLAQ